MSRSSSSSSASTPEGMFKEYLKGQHGGEIKFTAEAIFAALTPAMAAEFPQSKVTAYLSGSVQIEVITKRFAMVESLVKSALQQARSNPLNSLSISAQQFQNIEDKLKLEAKDPEARTAVLREANNLLAQLNKVSVKSSVSLQQQSNVYQFLCGLFNNREVQIDFSYQPTIAKNLYIIEQDVNNFSEQPILSSMRVIARTLQYQSMPIQPVLTGDQKQTAQNLSDDSDDDEDDAYKQQQKQHLETDLQKIQQFLFKRYLAELGLTPEYYSLSDTELTTFIASFLTSQTETERLTRIIPLVKRALGSRVTFAEPEAIAAAVTPLDAAVQQSADAKTVAPSIGVAGLKQALQAANQLMSKSDPAQTSPAQVVELMNDFRNQLQLMGEVKDLGLIITPADLEEFQAANSQDSVARPSVSLLSAISASLVSSLPESVANPQQAKLVLYSKILLRGCDRGQVGTATSSELKQIQVGLRDSKSMSVEEIQFRLSGAYKQLALQRLTHFLGAMLGTETMSPQSASSSSTQAPLSQFSSSSLAVAPMDKEQLTIRHLMASLGIEEENSYCYPPNIDGFILCLAERITVFHGLVPDLLDGAEVKALESAVRDISSQSPPAALRAVSQHIVNTHTRIRDKLKPIVTPFIKLIEEVPENYYVNEGQLDPLRAQFKKYLRVYNQAGLQQVHHQLGQTIQAALQAKFVQHHERELPFEVVDDGVKGGMPLVGYDTAVLAEIKRQETESDSPRENNSGDLNGSSTPPRSNSEVGHGGIPLSASVPSQLGVASPASQNKGGGIKDILGNAAAAGKKAVKKVADKVAEETSFQPQTRVKWTVSTVLYPYTQYPHLYEKFQKELAQLYKKGNFAAAKALIERSITTKVEVLVAIDHRLMLLTAYRPRKKETSPRSHQPIKGASISSVSATEAKGKKQKQVDGPPFKAMERAALDCDLANVRKHFKTIKSKVKSKTKSVATVEDVKMLYNCVLLSTKSPERFVKGTYYLILDEATGNITAQYSRGQQLNTLKQKLEEKKLTFNPPTSITDPALIQEFLTIVAGSREKPSDLEDEKLALSHIVGRNPATLGPVRKSDSPPQSTASSPVVGALPIPKTSSFDKVSSSTAFPRSSSRVPKPATSVPKLRPMVVTIPEGNKAPVQFIATLVQEDKQQDLLLNLLGLLPELNTLCATADETEFKEYQGTVMTALGKTVAMGANEPKKLAVAMRIMTANLVKPASPSTTSSSSGSDEVVDRLSILKQVQQLIFRRYLKELGLTPACYPALEAKELEILPASQSRSGGDDEVYCVEHASKIARRAVEALASNKNLTEDERKQIGEAQKRLMVPLGKKHEPGAAKTRGDMISALKAIDKFLLANDPQQVQAEDRTKVLQLAADVKSILPAAKGQKQTDMPELQLESQEDLQAPKVPEAPKVPKAEPMEVVMGNNFTVTPGDKEICIHLLTSATPNEKLKVVARILQRALQTRPNMTEVKLEQDTLKRLGTLADLDLNRKLDNAQMERCVKSLASVYQLLCYQRFAIVIGEMLHVGDAKEAEFTTQPLALLGIKQDNAHQFSASPQGVMQHIAAKLQALPERVLDEGDQQELTRLLGLDSLGLTQDEFAAQVKVACQFLYRQAKEVPAKLNQQLTALIESVQEVGIETAELTESFKEHEQRNNWQGMYQIVAVDLPQYFQDQLPQCFAQKFQQKFPEVPASAASEPAVLAADLKLAQQPAAAANPELLRTRLGAEIKRLCTAKEFVKAKQLIVAFNQASSEDLQAIESLISGYRGLLQVGSQDVIKPAYSQAFEAVVLTCDSKQVHQKAQEIPSELNHRLTELMKSVEGVVEAENLIGAFKRCEQQNNWLGMNEIVAVNLPEYIKEQLPECFAQRFQQKFQVAPALAAVEPAAPDVDAKLLQQRLQKEIELSCITRQFDKARQLILSFVAAQPEHLQEIVGLISQYEALLQGKYHALITEEERKAFERLILTCDIAQIRPKFTELNDRMAQAKLAYERSLDEKTRQLQTQVERLEEINAGQREEADALNIGIKAHGEQIVTLTQLSQSFFAQEATFGELQQRVVTHKTTEEKTLQQRVQAAAQSLTSSSSTSSSLSHALPAAVEPTVEEKALVPGKKLTHEQLVQAVSTLPMDDVNLDQPHEFKLPKNHNHPDPSVKLEALQAHLEDKQGKLTEQNAKHARILEEQKQTLSTNKGQLQQPTAELLSYIQQQQQMAAQLGEDIARQVQALRAREEKVLQASTPPAVDALSAHAVHALAQAGGEEPSSSSTSSQQQQVDQGADGDSKQGHHAAQQHDGAPQAGGPAEPAPEKEAAAGDAKATQFLATHQQAIQTFTEALAQVTQAQAALEQENGLLVETEALQAQMEKFEAEVRASHRQQGKHRGKVVALHKAYNDVVNPKGETEKELKIPGGIPTVPDLQGLLDLAQWQPSSAPSPTDTMATKLTRSREYLQARILHLQASKAQVDSLDEPLKGIELLCINPINDKLLERISKRKRLINNDLTGFNVVRAGWKPIKVVEFELTLPEIETKLEADQQGAGPAVVLPIAQQLKAAEAETQRLTALNRQVVAADAKLLQEIQTFKVRFAHRDNSLLEAFIRDSKKRLQDYDSSRGDKQSNKIFALMTGQASQGEDAKIRAEIPIDPKEDKLLTQAIALAQQSVRGQSETDKTYKTIFACMYILASELVSATDGEFIDSRIAILYPIAAHLSGQAFQSPDEAKLIEGRKDDWANTWRSWFIPGYKMKVETVSYMNLFYSAMLTPLYVSMVARAEHAISERQEVYRDPGRAQQPLGLPRGDSLAHVGGAGSPALGVLSSSASRVRLTTPHMPPSQSRLPGLSQPPGSASQFQSPAAGGFSPRFLAPSPSSARLQRSESTLPQSVTFNILCQSPTYMPGRLPGVKGGGVGRGTPKHGGAAAQRPTDPHSPQAGGTPTPGMGNGSGDGHK